MSLPSTPTKSVRQDSQNANDLCRLCETNLKLTKRSFENLFKSSRRQDSKGVVLAEELQKLGIAINQTPEYSDRVCAPCGRKIKNGSEIVTWLKERTKCAQTCAEPCHRLKRGLSTTITPERKTCFKAHRRSGISSKNLFHTSKSLDEDKENFPSVNSGISEEDKIKNLMNIDIDTTDESVRESKVKVFISYRNGNVTVTENFDKLTTTIIRGIALKKWSTVANSIFKHEELSVEIPDVVRRKISDEFKSLSTESTLKGSSPEELCAFSNKVLIHEVSVKCPLWYGVLNGAVGLDLRENDDRRKSYINAMALSTSALARQRNPTLSAHAYRISLVLFHSGISYYDTVRLNHLGICMSPSRLVNLQKQMGNSCDSRLLLWKKDIEEVKSAIKLIHEIQDKQVPKRADNDMDIDVSVRIDEEQLKTDYSSYNKPAYEMCVSLIHEAMRRKDEMNLTSDIIQDVLHVLTTRKLPYYKIVGDNIDAHINARYQSCESTNKSIHWTQQYGVLDRVNEPHLDNTEPQKSLDEVQLMNLLPVKEVQDEFKKNCAILISRVVSKHLKPFKHFQDIVERHIPHRHSKEMAEKSEICCLGLQFKNPNVAGEMAQLLMTNQQRYVPCLNSAGDLPEIAARIPLHGDQLFEERARNVQWTFVDGINSYDRLEGIITEAADWHAKLNLYSIEFDMFVNEDSAREVGTSRASMNRTGKTRAAQGVKKYFNEYKDFHQSEIEAHICASFMEMVHMSDVNDECDLDIPNASVPKETRKSWFTRLCLDCVEEFFGGSKILRLVNEVDELQKLHQNGFECRQEGCHAKFVHHSRRVIHEVEVHQLTEWTGDAERDFIGYYYCRARCGRVYSTKSTRNRHERTAHSLNEENVTQAEDNKNEESKEDKDPEDYIYNYHRAKLVFGLILLEFEDAIKEGDGDRVLNIYKIALLLYKTNKHTKYAYVTLLYLVNEHAALTAFQAKSLRHNRFYNKYGGQGKNIPLDLKMEQLNKILKSLWRGLGANLNESNASRVANAIEGLECVMESIDRDCTLSGRQGYRSKKSSENSVQQIIADLIEKKAFKYTLFREGHPSFKKFSANLLHGLDYRDLHAWMTELIHKWQTVLPKQN